MGTAWILTKEKWLDDIKWLDLLKLKFSVGQQGNDKMCIRDSTKGGMIVDVFGIEAFLPGSQIDVKPIRDYDVFAVSYTHLKVIFMSV